MIGHVEGVVRKVGTGSVILSTSGVGYKIACMRETASSLQEGTTAALWTYLAVREDALDLYGFPAEEELRFFELLLTVSGIGPKSALAILDIAAVETLRSAIASENAAYLTNVSGIGKKTAEKIVLELKDKVGKASEGLPMTSDGEALEAMRTLGYSAQEARDALRKVPANIESSSERLREALRIVGKKS
jgi:Holliday junction DNA helicase RuvA